MSVSPIIQRWKSSDLGQIPEDWDVETISNLGGKVTSGSRGWAEYYSDYGDLFIRITNLRRSSIHLDLTNLRCVKVPADNSEAKRTRLKVGDLLISITADIGIIGYVDINVPSPAYINQHIARVRFNEGRTSSKFIAYYLSSWTPQRMFIGSTDTGAKAGMNLTAVGSLKTVVPPFDEQVTIAEALYDTDEQISRLERLLSKKQSIKQGMIQQLLTGNARFPKFDATWSSGRLGDIAEVIMGQSPVGTSYNRDHIGPPLINGPTEFTQRYPVAKQWTTAPVRFCKPQDVLICVRGSSTGRTNVADAEYCIGRGVAAVRARGRNDQDFVYYALSAVVEELLKLQTGSTFPSIDSKVIKGGEILIPEPAEQRSIAQALHDADELIANLKQLIAKQRSIKLGMMQELLSGRTRLSVTEAVS